MSDQDSYTEPGITIRVRQQPGKPFFIEAFPEANPDVSDEEKLLVVIRELAVLADGGNVAAGTALLSIAIAVVEDPRVEVGTELRKWLGQVLRRLEANPNGAGVRAFAPRPADDGRRPAYSDDLEAALRFGHIKFMGCAFARAAKSLYHLKASAAFDRAAEMLTQHGFVDPKTAKPYTGAAVKGWFYISGQTFGSLNCALCMNSPCSCNDLG